MKKSVRLKVIYDELRRSGVEAAAGDLLRLAHLIFNAYTYEPDEFDEYGRPKDDRAFISLPVDIAMRDGGWRVLEFEGARLVSWDEPDASEFEMLRRHIKSYLGPEWQQQIPPG